MIKIENPKYKSAFLTLLFYIFLFLLISIRYIIMPSGNEMMIIETIAPIALPLLVLVLLFKNIWQYYHKSKSSIFSIVIHASIILVFFLLLIKLR